MTNLTKSVPLPADYETEEWYHKDMDRVKAEEVLGKFPVSGAFLVRPTLTSKTSSFAISFV